jgi:lysophospholipase L1-like esterase
MNVASPRYPSRARNRAAGRSRRKGPAGAPHSTGVTTLPRWAPAITALVLWAATGCGSDGPQEPGAGAGGATAGGLGGATGAGGATGGATGASGGTGGSVTQDASASAPDGGAGGRAGAPDGGAGASDGGAGAGGRAGSGGRGGAGGTAGGAGGSGPLAKLTIFVAGDSTVMTYVNSAIHQAGWGQFLGSYFTAQATVDNRAIGGRTSRRFIEEGRLTSLLAAAKAGDYLLVQFGTNDSNRTALYPDGEPYYLAPATDFKTYMQQYIDGAKTRGVRPVLVTPPPRNSCQANGVSFNYSFGAYATAMKELGQAGGVPVVDLGQMTVDYLDAKNDCGWASQNFFLINADGTVDGTHFQENGAHIQAGLIASGISMLQLPLAAYLQ